MDIESAISVIESVAGFTDNDTPCGEAWSIVLGERNELARRLAEAEARAEAAEAVVAKLPKTADGVPITQPGVHLYSSNPQYTELRFVTTSWMQWDPLNQIMEHGWSVYAADEDGRAVRCHYTEDIDCLYSTREAAEAAKEAPHD